MLLLSGVIFPLASDIRDCWTHLVLALPRLLCSLQHDNSFRGSAVDFTVIQHGGTFGFRRSFNSLVFFDQTKSYPYQEKEHVCRQIRKHAIQSWMLKQRENEEKREEKGGEREEQGRKRKRNRESIILSSWLRTKNPNDNVDTWLLEASAWWCKQVPQRTTMIFYNSFLLFFALQIFAYEKVAYLLSHFLLFFLNSKFPCLKHTYTKEKQHTYSPF